MTKRIEFLISSLVNYQESAHQNLRLTVKKNAIVLKSNMFRPKFMAIYYIL